MLYEVIDNFAYFNPVIFDFIVNIWSFGVMLLIQGVMINKIIKKGG